MSGRRLRSLLALSVLAAALTKLVQALRGEATPAFARHHRVVGGPPVPKVSLGAALAPTTTVEELPPDDGADPPIVPGTLSDTDVDTGPTGGAGDGPATIEPTDGGPWVAPTEGCCPDGYPVKAKVRSGIYHLPGMSAYDRTTPDRCYPTAEAAQADGLRVAKR